jgi:hypothetical protein
MLSIGPHLLDWLIIAKYTENMESIEIRKSVVWNCKKLHTYLTTCFLVHSASDHKYKLHITWLHKAIEVVKKSVQDSLRCNKVSRVL